MANFTNVAPSTSAISRFFATVGDFFVSVAEAQSRSASYKALNDLSDAELQTIGLKREEIGRHVFRDKLFM